MALKNNIGHRQDNILLNYPVYVCLGVYYILEFIASPFIWLWNTLSDFLYNNVTDAEKNDLRVAYMDEEQKKRELAAITKLPTKKNIKVSEKLIREREKLIKSMEGEEKRSEKPVTFRYTALSPDGEIVVNTFIAFSKIEVFTFLENEGNKVFKIETSPMIERMYGPSKFASKKIKIKDIVFWLTQLKTYIKAGIPLTDSMRILSKQMGKNENIKRTFDSVIYNLTLGESFSACLEHQGEAFPMLLVNMVKAAEATGDLEGTLDEMADYYSGIETTRKQMRSALIYPIMILLFSIAVIIFVLVYLVPQFVSIYNNAGVTLNPITAFLVSVSSFMKQNLFYILVITSAIIFLVYILYKHIKAFRYFLQTLMMKLPILGNIIIYKEMAIFTKTFASLLKNNVFITDSMDILEHITSNEIYKEIIINTINYIGRGEKISSAFKNHWAIPDVAYYMMVTGESTGELALMMKKVSEYYTEQHKVFVDSMKNLIEPILIIFLAVVVGGIIIAVIVPMFSLYSQIM